MSFQASTAFGPLLPYVRADSAAELAALLAENHASHHCFFNTSGMHNHLVHQLVADFTLGSSPSELRDHFAYTRTHYLDGFAFSDRSRYDPHTTAELTNVSKVDEHTWSARLGRPSHYWSYLHFFRDQIEQTGIKATLDRYVWSAEANGEGRQMVARFYGGVLHAAIHFGYAVETGVVPLAAEALAMAAVTSAKHTWLTQHDWLTAQPRGGSGLLELVSELQKDERVSPQALRLREYETSLPDEPFEKDGAGYGVIHEYLDRWNISNADVASAELALLAVLALGTVPRKDGAYHHDFFLMHLNNVHLFTPLLRSVWSDAAHDGMLLRALGAHFLYIYLVRGRPAFTAHNLTHPLCTEEQDWPELFRTARESVDEHLPKAVRTLYVHSLVHPTSQHQAQLTKLLGTTTNETPELYRATAQQMVDMHTARITPTKHQAPGEHQEFWQFQPFF